MNTYEMIFVLAITLWNIIVFFIYGADKRKAKRGRRRISENALLLSAFIMGGIGAALGMYVFRHKTQHLKFKLGVPLAIAFNIASIAAFAYLSK